MIFKITGGIYPSEYRSTTLNVSNAKNIPEGYMIAKAWCKSNFKKHNSILHLPNNSFVMNVTQGIVRELSTSHVKGIKPVKYAEITS